MRNVFKSGISHTLSFIFTQKLSIYHSIPDHSHSQIPTIHFAHWPTLFYTALIYYLHVNNRVIICFSVNNVVSLKEDLNRFTTVNGSVH